MLFLPRLVLGLPRLTLSFLMSGLMLLAMAYAVFALYVLTLTPKDNTEPLDAVIVLTGGTGRVQAGFDIMEQGRAKALLITGVHSDVRLQDLLQGSPQALQKAILTHCCVSLGYVAESTEDNALEAAEWVQEQKLPKNARIWVVTSDFHMPRALLQFSRILPQAELFPWPVKSNSQERGFWRNLSSEFGKFILGVLSHSQANNA